MNSLSRSLPETDNIADNLILTEWLITKDQAALSNTYLQWGDWVVRDQDGDLHVMTDEDFHQTYVADDHRIDIAPPTIRAYKPSANNPGYLEMCELNDPDAKGFRVRGLGIDNFEGMEFKDLYTAQRVAVSMSRVFQAGQREKLRQLHVFLEVPSISRG